MAGQPPKHRNSLIHRGIKKPSPSGTLTFLGLRSLDSILQYNLLAGSGAMLLAKAGIATITNSTPLQTGLDFIDSLGLPASHLVILAMAVGSVVKQVYWLTLLSQETFPPVVAVAVSAYNTFVNTANTLLFLTAATSSLSAPMFPGTSIPYPLLVGPALYTVGIVLETVAEYQRKKFKDDPANRGKVMRSGLWAWARHINYGGYALWRSAYSLASSGLVAALAMGSFRTFDFLTRSVPELNAYCSERYGEQWESFRRDVRWTLLPGIY